MSTSRDRMNRPSDPRDIKHGREIPTATYSDQPYIVKTDDGAWLCCVTTGVGREREPGQTVATMHSMDLGRTWSAPVFVEPADGPEASYGVMLKVPSGRVYIFYNHKTDNIREIPAEPSAWFPGGVCKRVDSLGYFVFKYSDDGGRTWSARRYPIPVREMDIDRRNPFGGRIRYFWNVGKPFIHDGAAFVSLHKVGGIGEGFFFVVDGILNNDGDARQFGWGRYSPHWRGPSRFSHRGAVAPDARELLRIGSDFHGEIRSVRVYDRTQRISEAIGAYRYGLSSWLKHAIGMN